MCAKSILGNWGTLKSLPECKKKNQEVGNKAVKNYPHALEFVPESFMTQKMCYKAANTYPSAIRFVPECFMTHEMHNKALLKMISEELIPITRHPKRWWNFCVPEDEKKEIEPIFTEGF